LLTSTDVPSEYNAGELVLSVDLIEGPKHQVAADSATEIDAVFAIIEALHLEGANNGAEKRKS
jgi:hypothetical protein